MTNPSLYRLMFSADVDKSTFPNLDQAGNNAFALLLGILDRGQKSGALKKQPVRAQASATWSLLHGFTMLAIDGQLLPEKVGAKPIDGVLACMLEVWKSRLRCQPASRTACSLRQFFRQTIGQHDRSRATCERYLRLSAAFSGRFRLA